MAAEPGITQNAQGSGIIQIAVQGSRDVSITIGGQTVVRLEALAFPYKIARQEEIDLLKAPFASTPFVGRDALMAEFLKWCDSEEPLSLRTVTGQGGAGKTRFAYELYARVRGQEGWDARFVRFLRSEPIEIDLWSKVEAKNALLIVDYASDYVRQLVPLLRGLIPEIPAGRRMRVLLLARSADWKGGWLQSLRAAGADRYSMPKEPVQLGALDVTHQREISDAAMKKVAEISGRKVPAGSEIPPWPNQGDPLTAMMAAVVAVRTGNVVEAFHRSRADLACEVADELVAMRMRRMVTIHTELFLHMAAYVTVCGGFSSREDALRALNEEIKETCLGDPGDRAQFVFELQGWLPGGPVTDSETPGSRLFIGAIEPDLVGEAFVLTQYPGDDDTILRVFARNATEAIEFAYRTTVDFPTESGPRRWLRRMLDGATREGPPSVLRFLGAAPGLAKLIPEMGGQVTDFIVLNSAPLDANKQQRVIERLHQWTQLESGNIDINSARDIEAKVREEFGSGGRLSE